MKPPEERFLNLKGENMEHQPNEIETVPNKKLETLQKHLAAIAIGERQDASGITPHDVGVEGMYNIHQALLRLRARGKKPGNEELRV
jgi:hypothetical protein